MNEEQQKDKYFHWYLAHFFDLYKIFGLGEELKYDPVHYELFVDDNPDDDFIDFKVCISNPENVRRNITQQTNVD